MTKDKIKYYLDKGPAPLRSYKEYSNISYVIKSIPPEEKIESIQYFLSNPSSQKNLNLFFKLLSYNFYDIDDLIKSQKIETILSCCSQNPKFISFIPENVLLNETFMSIFLAYDLPSEVFDYLPQSLRSASNISQKFNRKEKIYNQKGFDRDGYDSTWHNANGELIQFFILADTIKINSKEDYLKLVKEYLDSKITVPKFCKKYQISSEEGFNHLLDRVSKENSLINDEIQEIKNNSQNSFKKLTISIIDNIKSGQLTIEEYFNKYYSESHNINTILNFATLKNCNHEIAKKIIDYYTNYNDPYTTSMLSFFNFFTGYKPLTSLPLLKDSLKLPEDRNYIKALLEISKKIDRHRVPFKRQNSRVTYIINNQTYKITDDVLDQTINYLKQNHIHVCSYSINFYAKMIVTGKLDYTQETISAKNQMKKNILELLKQKQNIDDYIATIKELDSPQNTL